MFFPDFLESNIPRTEQEQLPAEFEQAAASAPESTPERVTVTLDLDADVLEWLKAQPTEWQREINNAMRFFMETNLIRESTFEDAIQTQRGAHDIDHDYIPF